VLAATGGALVAYHIDRTKTNLDAVATDDDTDEEISHEEIEADIESAMEDVELNWGGVERTDGADLNIQPSEVEGEMDVQGLDVEPERVTRSGIDEQVEGLSMVKGDQKTTDRSSSSVDDQTNKLAELRAQKREEAQNEDEETVLGSLRDRLSALLGRA
jgi:hypothetical protein